MGRSALLTFTVVSLLLGAAPGRACEPASPTIQALLDAERFEQAEQLARSRVDAQPDSPEARFDLALVYLRWSLQERVEFDVQALLPSSGEATSEVQMDQETMEEALRSRIVIDPKRGAKAAVELEGVLESSPRHRQAHLCLAELHQRLGEDDAYLTALERGARVLGADGVASSEVFLRFPRYDWEQGRGDRAVRAYRVLTEVFPESAPLLSSHGAVLAQREELSAAIDLFTRARALAPDDSLVLHNLAFAATLTGRLDLAADVLAALEQIAPDADNRLEIAMVATARAPSTAEVAWTAFLDQPFEATEQAELVSWLRSFAGVVVRDPGDATLVEGARSLLRARPVSAIALLHGVAARRPKDGSVLFLLAQGLELEGFPQAAFGRLEAANSLRGHDWLLEITPESLYYETGRVALKAGRYGSGVAYLEKVAAIQPDRRNIQYLLGWAHSAAGNRERAREYFAACLAKDNNAKYASWCRKNLDEEAAPAGR